MVDVDTDVDDAVVEVVEGVVLVELVVGVELVAVVVGTAAGVEGVEADVDDTGRVLDVGAVVDGAAPVKRFSCESGYF